MLHWLMLAAAADKVLSVQDEAKENCARARISCSCSRYVIIRPVDLTEKAINIREEKFLWWKVKVGDWKCVLEPEPWGVISVRRSFILGIREFQDGLGAKYCKLTLSLDANIERNGERVSNVYVPIPIEEVSKALEDIYVPTT